MYYLLMGEVKGGKDGLNNGIKWAYVWASNAAGSATSVACGDKEFFVEGFELVYDDCKGCYLCGW